MFVALVTVSLVPFKLVTNKLVLVPLVPRAPESQVLLVFNMVVVAVAVVLMEAETIMLVVPALLAGGGIGYVASEPQLVQTLL